MIRSNFCQRRLFLAAFLDRERAARMEAATLGHRRSVGDEALDRREALLLEVEARVRRLPGPAYLRA